MKSAFKIKRRQRKGISFNPDREFVEDAIRDFLSQGGKINQVEVDDDNCTEFIAFGEGTLDADEFLMGN